jgi:hypothetical protein
MEQVQPRKGEFNRRAIRLLLLCLALAACLFFAARSRFGPAEPAPADDVPGVQAFDPETAYPRVVLMPPPLPKADEPLATRAREAVLRRDAEVIRAECQRAAGGDWERWQHDTAPYRTTLLAKLDALKAAAGPSRFEVLEGRNGFPLFEIRARDYLGYLLDPGSLDAFRKNRPLVAAHRWLREKGIDLVFVPVPKMTEVYAEHFLDPCPTDGVFAPHVRRTLLEMLDAGVEVVDGWSLFRPQRDTDAEYLYNSADTHWGPRAMRVTAKELADRLVRYKFGARARYGLPVVTARPGPYGLPGVEEVNPRVSAIRQNGWPWLSKEQQERAAKVHSTSQVHVTLPDGREPPDNPESSVLLVGDSFVPHFREQLVKELNLLVSCHWQAGTMTEQFGDFLREPELLKNCRVLVWVMTEQNLAKLGPLPPPIAAYADAK